MNFTNTKVVLLCAGFLLMLACEAGELSDEQQQGSADNIYIADANLRALLEAELGKSSGEAISQSEAATLSLLQAYNQGISDLTGLEHFTGLIYLDLSRNNVSNLSPLSSLSALNHLGLNENSAFSDLTPISSLTSLMVLHFNDTSVSSLQAVSSLTALEELGAGNLPGLTSLVPLHGISTLQNLIITDSSVPQSEVDALEAAVPGIVITT